MSNNKSVLFETDNYFMTIGPALFGPENKEVIVYQIVNKETGVIEIEEQIFPAARLALDKVQKELELANKRLAKESEDREIRVIN